MGVRTANASYSNIAPRRASHRAMARASRAELARRAVAIAVAVAGVALAATRASDDARATATVTAIATPTALDARFLRWMDARALAATDDARARGMVVARVEDWEDERAVGARRTRGAFGARGGKGEVETRIARDAALERGATTAGAGKDEWALAIELMRERAKGGVSAYAPFVESLYEHTPARAVETSRAARARLEGHAAAETMREYERDAEDGWRAARRTFETFPSIFSVHEFTRAAFEEALAIVRANSFEARSEDGTRARALVPMAHLLLHDTGSEVPCVKIVDGVFVINVDEHEEGDELSCSHGDYSDAETFARFGVSAFYSAEKNARNKIKFAFPSEIYSMKSLDRCGSVENIAFTDAGATEEFMCALRLASANETEWAAISKSKASVRALRKKPLSEESEIAVYEALFATLTELLNSYPSSDNEDERLLQSRTLQSAPDEERAVTIRLREKRLALSSLNAVQYAGRQQLGGLLFDKHFADVLPSPVNVRQTNG